MRTNTSGYRTDNCNELDAPNTPVLRWRCEDSWNSNGEFFYADLFHPSGRTGHR